MEWFSFALHNLVAMGNAKNLLAYFLFMSPIVSLVRIIVSVSYLLLLMQTSL